MATKLEAYLATLPSGLGSFGNCRAKGSLIRTSLALKPLRSLDALPPELAKHARQPPLASEWVAETHYVGISLATADEYGLDRDGFREFWRSVMHALTDGMYSTLLGLAHPETLVRGTAARWAHFHEGTRVSAARESGSFIVRFTLPTGLFPELLIDGYAGVLQGLIDRSRKPEGRATRGPVSVEGANTVATYVLAGW